MKELTPKLYETYQKIKRGHNTVGALAVMFGTTKTAIRERLKKMQKAGVIEVAVGYRGVEYVYQIKEGVDVDMRWSLSGRHKNHPHQQERRRKAAIKNGGNI